MKYDIFDAFSKISETEVKEGEVKKTSPSKPVEDNLKNEPIEKPIEDNAPIEKPIENGEPKKEGEVNGNI